MARQGILIAQSRYHHLLSVFGELTEPITVEEPPKFEELVQLWRQYRLFTSWVPGSIFLKNRLRGLPYQQIPHLCFSSLLYGIVLVLINDLQSCTNVPQMVAADSKAFRCLGGFYVDLHVLYNRLQDPLSIRWKSLTTWSEMEVRDAGGALFSKYEAVLTQISTLESQYQSLGHDYSTTFSQTRLLEVRIACLRQK